jgi:hypothetical protein
LLFDAAEATDGVTAMAIPSVIELNVRLKVAAARSGSSTVCQL